MATLLKLPNEVLLQICGNLDAERHISSLSRTSRSLYTILQKYLVRYNVRNSESSALLWAARNGDEQLARKVLEEGGSAAMKGGADDSPLTLAARNGHESLTRLFLECEDVDPDWKSDCDGSNTPLSAAASSGHVGIAKLLLATGRVNPSINSGQPLHSAIDGGHEAMVQLLLAHGALEMDTDFGPGPSALARAAEEGRFGIMKMLLDTGLVDPNDGGDWYFITPLTWSACRGDIAAVKLLLGCDSIVPDMSHGSTDTPLAAAAKNRHLEVVNLLLATGDVDPDSSDGVNRNSILHSLLCWCLDRGRYRTRHESRGDEEGRGMDIAKLLILHGADPDSKNAKGRTPIWFAIKFGSVAMVKLLLETGRVDLAHKDIKGRTSIWFAIKFKSVAMVKLLLATGRVDITHRDIRGRSPLDYAKIQGDEEIVNLLRGSMSSQE